jgi:hypothetical protein
MVQLASIARDAAGCSAWGTALGDCLLVLLEPSHDDDYWSGRCSRGAEQPPDPGPCQST